MLRLPLACKYSMQYLPLFVIDAAPLVDSTVPRRARTLHVCRDRAPRLCAPLVARPVRPARDGSTTPDRHVSVWGGAYLAICPYLLSDLKCQAGRFERRAGRFECRIGWFECKVGQFEYHNLLNVHIVCSVSTSRASSSAFAASTATRARSRRARSMLPPFTRHVAWIAQSPLSHVLATVN